MRPGELPPQGKGGERASDGGQTGGAHREGGARGVLRVGAQRGESGEGLRGLCSNLGKLSGGSRGFGDGGKGALGKPGPKRLQREEIMVNEGTSVFRK